MTPWHRFLDFVSSIKLTLVCLVAALLLVFVGTMAQVHFSAHAVQERYFQSMLVWWPGTTATELASDIKHYEHQALEGQYSAWPIRYVTHVFSYLLPLCLAKSGYLMASHGFRIPVFPGGHLLGAVLLVNLLAAHLRRFRLNWRNVGIHLTHGGLIVMLAGGLFTDLFSVDSHMQIGPGETKNYSEDTLLRELVIIDGSNADADRIAAIPEARLRRGETVNLRGFPFRVEIKHYYENSRLDMLDKAGAGAQRAADHGPGAQVTVTEIPRAAADGNDLKSVVIHLVPTSTRGDTTTASLGTWLVSEGLGAPQTFSFAGGSWRLELRPVRYYKPYSITLQKFTHETYPGTDIPKNFASTITLADPDKAVNRDVLIYMNHPFRYAGETYYQSGFGQDDKSSILQVVHNPSFIAPYIGCAVIGLGLLIQFGYSFVGFTRRTASLRAK